jgi:hypothetical protein
VLAQLEGINETGISNEAPFPHLLDAKSSCVADFVGTLFNIPFAHMVEYKSCTVSFFDLFISQQQITFPLSFEQCFQVYHYFITALPSSEVPLKSNYMRLSFPLEDFFQVSSSVPSIETLDENTW